MDFDAFYEQPLPYIKEVNTKDYDLKKIAKMVQTRIEIFPDIKEHIDFFEELPEYDVAMYTHKKMKTNAETSLEVLQDVLQFLRHRKITAMMLYMLHFLSMLRKRAVKMVMLCGQSVQLFQANR